MRVFFRRSLLILGLLLSAPPVFADLEIGSNPVLRSVLNESRNLGSTPEVYLLSQRYRLDLTLIDLVDQVALLTEDEPAIFESLKAAYLSTNGNPFLAWFDELERIASINPSLREKLDRRLRLFFYTPEGYAVSPKYRFVDLDKLKDNAVLARIRRYNEFAQDAEGPGLLLLYERELRPPFFTKPMTVAKMKEESKRDLRRLRNSYYKTLIRLYEKYDRSADFHYHSASGKLKATTPDAVSLAPYRTFNILAGLPNKHEVLLFLAAEVPGIPYDSGLVILTPAFIEKNRKAISGALRKYTQNQIVQTADDEYLLGLRKWIRENRVEIQTQIEDYNSSHSTRFVLFYKDPARLPRRAEAILNHEVLLKIYDEIPWMSKEHGLLFDKKGREKFVVLDPEDPKNRFLKNIFHELVQTENYVSILVGIAATILTHGNVPVAMSVRKVTKDGIEALRYDHEWKTFLREIPSDVLDAFLVGTGVSAGRLYKILALGAGRGAIQSLLTGQDVKTGAAVGMLYNLVASYLIPNRIAHPMAKGFDEKALRLNRRLELLEGAVRGTLQGGTVALIAGDPLAGGLIKGFAYGAVSTQLLIWVMGTRYNPFQDFSDASVDRTIDLENQLQNEVGRGGVYDINRQLILDANYRVGGILQDAIEASITLPGNVAMSDSGFRSLSTLTHEASHLMQQEQSGVFGFYLFRYLPTSLRTGYNGHPDENFLIGVR